MGGHVAGDPGDRVDHDCDHEPGRAERVPMLRTARRGPETTLRQPPASDEDDSDDRADPKEDACIRGEVTEQTNTAGVGAAEAEFADQSLQIDVPADV